MAKPVEPPKKPVTIEAIGMLRTKDGFQVVTVLADESQIITRSVPDVMGVAWPEFKKAAVAMRMRLTQ